jgi:hypothetical protein
VNTSSWYDIKKKENNTKATINGDKEMPLGNRIFCGSRTVGTGARGALLQPQTFGKYIKIIHIREGGCRFSDLPTALELLIRSASLLQKLLSSF